MHDRDRPSGASIDSKRDAGLEARDLDRSERDFERIEPLLTFIYASVIAILLQCILLPVLPDVFRLPLSWLTASLLVSTLLAAYAINGMSKGLAILLSFQPVLMALSAFAAPTLFIGMHYLKVKQASMSITLDPYEFRDTEIFSLRSPRNLQLALSSFITIFWAYALWRAWIAIARLRKEDRRLLQPSQNCSRRASLGSRDRVYGS